MFKLIKFILRLVVLAIVGSGLVLAYARYVEPKMLRTEEFSISSIQLGESARNLKVVAFADTHFSEHYTDKDFQKAVDKINELEPDIVVFLGDLIDNYNVHDGEPERISAQLAQIQATVGKFAVFGNHDYGGGSERHYENIMEAGGFTVLVNEYYPLEDLNIGIMGIDDVIIGYGDPHSASLCREDMFNIVLSHAPDIVDDMLDYPIDLMLAGHTHGMQVHIPFVGDDLLPAYGEKYLKGLYSFDNQRGTLLYVNSGLGTTKLPIRFLSIPEITKVTLTDIT